MNLFLATFLSLLFLATSVEAARIKDIASFKGMRSNQLIGYGLVVGLERTGDGSSMIFTIQSITNMLERAGIQVDPAKISQIQLKNVAAVMITATLPPFARVGSRIDVTVSSIGDAKTLQGGTLLMAPLKAVDQQIYALAQGPISIGGFAASGASGTGVQKNHPNVGRIAKGAIVEREVPVLLDGKKEVTLCLFNPDFTTADKIKEQVNRLMNGNYARCVDPGTLTIKVPEEFQTNVTEWISSLERLEILPDAVAKVVLNEKTGTVVLGEQVRISTVAVAHGNLSIQIKEKLAVSQPLPFAPAPPAGGAATVAPETGTIMTPGGATVVTPETDVSAKEEKMALMVIPSGVSLGEVIRALNAIGVTPRDLISILQSIKAAGALQADLEII